VDLRPLSDHGTRPVHAGAEDSDDPGRRDALYALTAELALGLLRSESLDQQIGTALAEVGHASGADRVYLFEARSESPSSGLVCDQRYEWVADGIEPQIDNPELQGLQIALVFPETHLHLLHGATVSANVDELPPSERGLLEAQGIQSILLVPVNLEDRLWGFLGFDAVRQRRTWSRAEQGVLTLLAAGLGAAVRRQRAERALQRAARVMESTRDAIVITDRAGRILSVNPALCRRIGHSTDELLGVPAVQLLATEGAEGSTLLHDIAAAVREQGYWEGECRAACRDGSRYPVWLSVTVQADRDGGPLEYVAVATDIEALKESEARLNHLAHHDPLTGVPNRSNVQTRLGQLLELSRQQDTRVAVFFLDLDRFKGVNDTLGHPAGDALLVQVVDRLRARLRGEDLLARLGGDEFLIVVAGPRNDFDPMQLAGDLCERLREPFDLAGARIHTAASIGVAMFPEHAEDAETLLQRADVAMYRAKQAGRDRACLYEASMSDLVRGAMRVETALREALYGNRLVLHLQPRLDLRSGRIDGAEALLRVPDGEGGLLKPGEVIHLAESVGLIVPVGRWVLNEACRLLASWRAAGLRDIDLSINVSALQFYAGDLLDGIRDALATYDVPASSLEIELTETVLMDRPQEAQALLRELRELGIRLALDDFGSGYSSLSYLMRFPVDRLKIDHEFIAHLPGDARAGAIAGAIIELAHRLELNVVAEGVETEEQLSFLRELGADSAQGYLFSRPVPEPEFRRLLADWTPRLT